LLKAAPLRIEWSMAESDRTAAFVSQYQRP
jgi:hypothetical protein